MDITLRIASPADAAALREIYAPYVLGTAITFEYEVPSQDEFARRIAETLKRLPYLVAEENGEAVGYAYAAPLHTRPACGWAVEASVYIRTDRRQSGIGRRLYEKLEEILKRQGFVNISASIADTDREDSHLPRGSIAFHLSRGFREVGRFHRCGYKFDAWYDLVWMEKYIGAHSAAMQVPLPFPALRDDLVF